MSFRRRLAPRAELTDDTLTAALVGIGMNFAADGAREPNIEDTVYYASIVGMEGGDLRVLAVLVTWLEIHLPCVNADRLTKLVRSVESRRVRGFWSAIARLRSHDLRLHRLAPWSGKRVDVLGAGIEFLIHRKGEDPRFADGPLRVPAEVLRRREADVLAPAELAARHRTYFWRVIIGPTYRADMWAEMERNPELSAAEIARRAYGSFSTAWHVRRDFATAGGAKPIAKPD